MDKLYTILLGELVIGTISQGYGYVKGIKKGIEWSAPVKVIQTDLNGDGVKDIIVYNDLRKDNSRIFIANTNGTYTPWEVYKSNLVNQPREGIEKLEREVESRVKGLEGRQ
ncbi:MAG: VCBS repeat-containing protein [Nanoarchaeota archaeon]